VDSSGLGVLTGAYVSFERNYRRLLLAWLNDRIRDLFRTCKIEDVFTRYQRSPTRSGPCRYRVRVLALASNRAAKDRQDAPTALSE
jgi:hypothetical protein